jgi:hypothetical protein
MKRCPTCQRTYPDDAPDYCSNDGMRLVREEAAEFDPERTVMTSGLRVNEPEAPQQPEAAPTPAQPYQAQSAQPGIKPPTQWQPPSEQSQQPWQSPGGQSSQPGWSPPPPPAPNWGGAPYQQSAANAQQAAPYAPAAERGRSRALAIAALVTGACAVTIMAIWVARSADFVLTSLLVLAILGLGLGVAALILALQKPARFGGVPLAIAGLAMGTAGLVYYFTL